jgi:hypothetical protein
MKKRKRLKTVRNLDRRTGQYSETRGLRSAAFNVSNGLPSSSDKTADELHHAAEKLLDGIGETSPEKIMLACGADRMKTLTEMRNLMTRLNSKYGVFSPPACAGKWLVTRYMVTMALFDLAGDSIDKVNGTILLIDEFSDANHWWHAELKGEHLAATAKGIETNRLRKQGRTTGGKGEIRAKIIRDAIDELPHPPGSTAAIARAIRPDVEKLFTAKGLPKANSDEAFYQEVRRALGKK